MTLSRSKSSQNLLSLLALTAALITIPPAAQAADSAASAQRGQKLFLHGAACHNLASGGVAKVGPVLGGVTGAAAAARTDYDYSAALRNAQLVWTDANLDKWLTQPGALVPGTKMAFVGLSDAADRAAVIAFLHQAAP